MPTRTGLPKADSQAGQAVMPVDVLAKQRTHSPWATSNQRAEMSTPNVWTVITISQRGRKLAEERADLLVTPVHAGSVASATVRPGWSWRCRAFSRQRRPSAKGKSRLSAPPVPERPALLIKIPRAKPQPCSGSTFVDVVEPVQDRARVDQAGPGCWSQSRFRRLQPECAVRALMVVIPHEFRQHRPQVLRVQHDDVVEALS